VTGPEALVIVPTYNERDNLPTLVAGVMRHRNVRMLIVDDESPDGTGAAADSLAREHSGRVQVIHRTGKRGLGRSYRDGFTQAVAEQAEVICQMDADLSHDPAQLPAIIAATSEADLVIGSRYVRNGAIVNWPVRRLLLSRLANLYVRAVTRLNVFDCTSGYRCWRHHALAKLPLDRIQSEGYSFLIETLYMAAERGARIEEVPITFVERRQGQSKLSLGVVKESVTTPWRLVAKDRTGMDLA